MDRSSDSLADGINTKGGNSFIIKVFRKGLIRQFSKLENGYILLQDGTEKEEFGDKNSDLRATLQVYSPEFYVLLGTGGAIGAAEAYTAGYWSSDNMVGLMRIMSRNKEQLQNIDKGITRFVKPINSLIHRSRQNTLKGSRANILAHYDLSNDFYKLWLDETMTYSCAIFEPQDLSLAEASIEKLDRVCRKLRLDENDRVIEIGTGWGSFAIHATKNYNCHVTTTTISDAQHQYVQNLILQNGLEKKITLLKKDYRLLEGKFSKLVSIEMIEAVGVKYIPEYIKICSRLLEKDGLMAIQGITYADQDFETHIRRVDFIKKYIFPGSNLISIANIIENMKQHTDLSLVHLEDITRHYGTTLKSWRERFMNVIPEIKNLGFSDTFIRLWEFYFVYCEAGFREHFIGDVQMIMAKPGHRKVKIEY